MSDCLVITSDRLGESLSVDRERNVIRGATLIERGPLRDGDVRPWSVDTTTLNQVVSFGNASPKGLKARWTHPKPGSDALGSYVGRWRKLRLSEDGARVIGDVHLARVAFHGGEASHGNWLMTAAEEDPESFGVSVTPIIDFEAMGEVEEAEGRLPLRFRNVLSADFVEEPAAVSGGLFGGASFATSEETIQAALSVLLGTQTSDGVHRLVNSYLAKRESGTPLNERGKDMAENAEDKGAAQAEAVTSEQLSAVFDSIKQLSEKVELLSKAPANPEPEAVADDVSKALAEDRKRCAELQALAENAGLANASEKAREWITKGLSVVEAKAALCDSQLATNGLSKDAGLDDGDPEAKFRREYHESLSAYQQMGVTEEEYLLSRKMEAVGL